MDRSRDSQFKKGNHLRKLSVIALMVWPRRQSHGPSILILRWSWYGEFWKSRDCFCFQFLHWCWTRGNQKSGRHVKLILCNEVDHWFLDRTDDQWLHVSSEELYGYLYAVCTDLTGYQTKFSQIGPSVLGEVNNFSPSTNSNQSLSHSQVNLLLM